MKCGLFLSPLATFIRAEAGFPRELEFRCISSQPMSSASFEGYKHERLVIAEAIKPPCLPFSVPPLLVWITDNRREESFLSIWVAVVPVLATISPTPQTLQGIMAGLSFIALVLVALGLIIGRSLIGKRRPPQGTRKIPGPKGVV